jgi:hypothetical protein
MEPKMTGILFKSAVCITFLLITSTTLAAKVYRWVDENGEVHYSESLPPDFQDKTHDELDALGIVREEGKTLKPPPPKPKVTTPDDPMELPRDASGMERPKALYSEKEMQERMDRFLLLRYDSEKEIEDAMEVEIKQLEYDRRLLKTSRDSMLAAWRGQIAEAANRQRAGVEVEPATSQEIAALKKRLGNNQKMIDDLRIREEEIRKTFGAEIERYRYLEETWAEES